MQNGRELRYSKDYRVELIGSDGSVSRSWITNEAVESSESSDGYYFIDSETGTLVEVSGTVVITCVD